MTLDEPLQLIASNAQQIAYSGLQIQANRILDQLEDLDR